MACSSEHRLARTAQDPLQFAAFDAFSCLPPQVKLELIDRGRSSRCYYIQTLDRVDSRSIRDETAPQARAGDRRIRRICAAVDRNDAKTEAAYALRAYRPRVGAAEELTIVNASRALARFS